MYLFSSHLLWAALIATVLALCSAVWALGAGQGWKRLWLRVVGMLTVFATGFVTFGLGVNASMDFFPTLDSLTQQLEPAPEKIGRQEHAPVPPRRRMRHDLLQEPQWQAEKYRQKFVPVRAGKVPGKIVQANFRGRDSQMRSGIQVWLPPNFDKKAREKYHVMVFLHGNPGHVDGLIARLQVGQVVPELVSEKRMAETIFVVPGLVQDGHEPDCVDIKGRPQVGTWVSSDVPRTIAASFPQVSRAAKDWTLTGVSSGAYCALHTAVTHPYVYGAGVGLNGYNDPELGMLHQLPYLQQRLNQISTMLRHAHAYPYRLFLGYTDNDPDSWQLVKQVASVPLRRKDQIVGLKESGGHNWDTWQKSMPAVFAWTGGAKPGTYGIKTIRQLGKELDAIPPNQSIWGPNSYFSASMLGVIALGSFVLALVLGPYLSSGALMSRYPRWRRRSAALIGIGARFFLIAFVLGATLLAFLVGVNLSESFFGTWTEMAQMVYRVLAVFF